MCTVVHFFFSRDTPTVIITTDGFKTINTFFTWIFGQEVICEHDLASDFRSRAC